MATIMFGSFSVALMGNYAIDGIKQLGISKCKPMQSVVAEHMAPPASAAKPLLVKYRNDSSVMVGEYDKMMHAFDAALKNNAGLQKRLFINQNSVIQKDKKGLTKIRHCTYNQALVRDAILKREAADHLAFLRGDYKNEAFAGIPVIAHNKNCGETVGFRTSFYRRTPKSNYKNVKARRNKPLKVEEVLKTTLKLSSETGIKVEFIGKSKRPTIVRYVKRGKALIPKMQLPHEVWNYWHQEVRTETVMDILPVLCKYGKYVGIHDSSFKPGDSGLIIPSSKLKGYVNSQYAYFIIRGRRHGKLVNALEWIDDISEVQHYSLTPEQRFFKGWKENFDRLVPGNENHQCAIDFDNEQCGKIAALISQAVYPVHKLSCRTCRAQILDMSWEGYKQFISLCVDQHKDIWDENKALLGVDIIEKFVRSASSESKNISAAMEIVKLTHNRRSTVMLQIQDINKALMQGSAVSQVDLDQALHQLLRMVQWWNNHISLTEEDPMKTFRNKRSAKVLLNPSLLCDNQLDKNGNFIWGERGYHSKRVFMNYFEEIKPAEGYERWRIRRHPNGERELAIGALIVPLSLERARIALQGHSIQRLPLTVSCTSKQDGNFAYPCCCVTLDNGTPLYSELRSPTKRHLVVGGTGEPKYIDLPAADSERMYIAKNGYCYLNIFLAMLVNVNESEAKNFTKMVRDVIIPMLGEWPTMQDVATATYILTVFHPETRNAELPRILVDHTCQTMHVIDSFGSLTTGYHVLKAGTISQLIGFAGNELIGEMKHYRVGGDAAQRMRCEKALITSIFKPKRMVQLLEEDPYILLMGMISPGVLIHIYRMRHFERAIDIWIKKEQSVAKIFVLLEQLTEKVAVSDILIDQLRIIENASSSLRSVLDNCCHKSHAYKPAQDILTIYLERSASNEQLVNNGYSDLNDKIYIALEKIYIDQLRQEWCALNLLERFSLTWRLKKFSAFTENYLAETNVRDEMQSSRSFVHECFMNAQTHLESSRIALLNKIRETWIYCGRKIFSFIFSAVNRCYGDILYFVNVMLVFSLMVQMTSVMHGIINEARKNKALMHQMTIDQNEKAVVHIYDMCHKMEGNSLTCENFLNHIRSVRPDLEDTAQYMVCGKLSVATQAKTGTQVQFEKIIAFMALITMIIDTERSDAIFKVLNKLKSVFQTMGDNVQTQSLDEIISIDEDKKLTIDFEIDTSKESPSMSFDVNFESWWNRQLQQNKVIAHYRNTGQFLEFTRETSAHVANQISVASETEFLIRGAVGSGKSTGLPHHLSKKGKVLLLEPTRPLAENVSKQLAKEPFYQQVTLRMRGLSKFGSSNITVMTGGFAFHYYVNNPHQLRDFDYIIIDECHVLDSSLIAFNCVLKEFEFPGKLLKVSATPPGRECEFTTQHAVKLKVEDQLSFQQFVQAQGSGSNADMVQHGSNLLVYVASYNEVDTLSRLLVEKHFKVTKVDGRTMQMGGVEIITAGTESKPHFIVATNIIENGVTLDVDCVIDFGLKVVATLDSDNKCVRYNKKSVAYGERIQRLGRVGRYKPGFALRIGHTEKGIEEIPEFIATEAAFLSFAYGLPVTTQSVSTNILGRCTVKQARSALNFELTPFFVTHFVKFDGTMHPEIHKILKCFKLRESEMLLNKTAIPYQYTSQWITRREMERIGVHIDCDDNVKIPFYVNGIPDKVFESLWDTVCKYRSDAGFGRLTSVNASKVCYTLSTDPTAVPRTIAIIDHLLSEEMMKKNHFDTLSSAITGHSFSLNGIAESIRKRYLRDHTASNIATLQQAKSQLQEFNVKHINFSNLGALEDLGILNAVQLQSKEEIGKFLGLKGKWDGKKFLNDIFLVGLALIGGGWMMWEYFTKKMNECVTTQGKKRMLQKLKFRDAFDRKVGREIFADDYTMEHTFGDAYTAKGKAKGSHHTKGMGRKTRNFTHMYGVEPENYSMIRFIDPLTGAVLDEDIHADIRLVQEEFGEIRKEKILEGDLDPQTIVSKPGIQAYFIGKGTEEALKVDLLPHRPTLMCKNMNAISGFPEREDELRQTGIPQKISRDKVPEPEAAVVVESKSVYKGVRDYNNIATLVCQLTNQSDGHSESIYGIGYGPYILTNGHLFRRNNGSLTVRTWHGEFEVKNTTQLKIHFIKGKDAIIIRMPKDFPPFARRNFFRGPVREERVCMIGTNFQEKSLRATVSESSLTTPEGSGSFWVHWITTQDGYCGMPLVSVNDGYIVGFHGLTSRDSSKNFFVPLENDFKEKYFDSAESLNWDKHWFWQPDKIAWGSLNLIENQPKDEFKISKLITDLFKDTVAMQSKRDRWVYESATGNLKACGQAESALVTKHTIKGKCPQFAQYLASNDEAMRFFKPLMGAYQPSKLNKAAFCKDFFKYNKPVVLNEVDFTSFEAAVSGVVAMMTSFGFSECMYVTDPDEILNSLNLKSAIGAQYKGKKQDYLSGCDEFDKERLLLLSSERLFCGMKGLWNGSLKAELRPLEKVVANKTRTFTAAPIDTLLGAKVCVDDFNNQFYSLNLKCPWTVGMTKFYGGWDQLMRKLPDGWVHCHADGSQFDSSLTPLLLNAVLGIRKTFMEKWWVGEEMLENLYAEIVYTPILTPDGTIFKKFRGNNSGQPSTVVDNTLMVVIAVYYACHKEGWSDSDIQNRLVFFANGDDIILSIEKENEVILDTFATSFSELGLNYNFNERTTERENLWFMSHKAIKIEDLYIPKLEPERIVSILEWDRSKEVMHRTEAICAAMIEAWGYTDLLREIRKFYLWLIERDEYRELAAIGKAPYIAETALKKLYTDRDANEVELQKYLRSLTPDSMMSCGESVYLQSDTSSEPRNLDAGIEEKKKKEEKSQGGKEATYSKAGASSATKIDKDINTGTIGRVVPRLQRITKKMNLPTVKGNVILSLDHLLEYKPNQVDLFNTRATHKQFESWYEAVRSEYELNDDQMGIVMNGFMVWCIDNGTSPDVTGTWVMMDGNEQVEYPLKPIVENAKPTLRQIMHHFSDAAEAYIEMRNSEGLYMPRYGLLRNLRDRNLARYAFDFYEVTSKTSDRAREAIAQMKAAALSSVSIKLFGLDGSVAITSEDTERHTARDVNKNMHTLLGMNSPQ
ncbi:polyprotein [Impatiens flower break virus]|uniref:Genome polyprotein n=1 Tax=Impatiens flower break virus TaxID=2170135 RepID=A0A182BQ71_9POTV|nr:polyprotein [Impatiens flower break virus]ANA48365.1 polyprotein [Impatiens flower break virus]